MCMIKFKNALYLASCLKLCCLFFLLSLLSACQSVTQPHPEIALAQQVGFKASLIKTNDFEFTYLIKKNPASQKLVIYIEGDGRSWIKKSILSRNPTPPYALGLRLAIQDPRSDTVIAYLTRPCQFTQQKPTPDTCDAKYWSSHRFSEQVIANMNQAVDHILSTLPSNTTLELIGYSGGASVALLLAARRKDVIRIRTVAGDLNHDKMSTYHHTTPLLYSLNPIHFISNLKNIPQIHYIGTQDNIAPGYIAEDFMNKIKQNQNKNQPKPELIRVQATHQTGWEAQWAKLLILKTIMN